MKTTTRRTTVYLDSDLHRALRLKSAECEVSVSQLINEALWDVMVEDAADLAAFEVREGEPTIGFEDFLKELKAHGKL